jgi:autotransporter-associated beta strand protein
MGTLNQLFVNGGTLTLADNLRIENTGGSTSTGASAPGAVLFGNNSAAGNVRITGTGNVTFHNDAAIGELTIMNPNTHVGAIALSSDNTAASQVSDFTGSVLIEKGLVIFNRGNTFGDSANVITLGAAGQGDAALIVNTTRSNYAVVANPIVVAAGSGGTLSLGRISEVSSNTAANVGTYSGSILLNDNLQLVSRTNSRTNGTFFTGDISGVGGLEKIGAGTSSGTTPLVNDGITYGHAKLQGNNTYQGDTKITQGILSVFNGNAIPNGPGTGNVILGSAGTLRVFDNETINGLSGPASTSGSKVNNGHSSPRTLTIGDNDATSTFSGIIENGNAAINNSNAPGGAFSIEKIGAGILTLDGNNTYTGTTSVNAGALTVNGTHSDAGAYSVNNGGTLGGAGSIDTAAGAGVIINAGGKLAPGAPAGALRMNLGAGQLSIGGAVASSGPSLLFELGGVGNCDFVQLANPASVLNIGNGALDFNDFAFSPLSGFATGVYTLFDTSNTIAGSLGSSLSGTIGAFGATISLANNNQDIILTVESIPNLVIDRQTGGMTLRGSTTSPTGILGYSISSGVGGLNQAGWTSIAGHYDAPSNGGIGTVDMNDAWTVLSASGGHTDLSEASLAGGDGGILGVDASINLGNSAWIRNVQEDVQMKLLLSNGTITTTRRAACRGALSVGQRPQGFRHYSNERGKRGGVRRVGGVFPARSWPSDRLAGSRCCRLRRRRQRQEHRSTARPPLPAHDPHDRARLRGDHRAGPLFHRHAAGSAQGKVARQGHRLGAHRAFPQVRWHPHRG